MHTKYVIRAMRYSCLLGDKFAANVSNKDHKIHHFVLHSINIRMLHSTFECYIQHSNVAFNIRMVQHSKVRANVEHLFIH